MGTPQYASTSETTNAGRASRVLLGPCSDMLRDVLRHYVPPSTFSLVVQKQKKKLQNLTKPQLDIIFPPSGPYAGNYNDFDISLLYKLLRNLCKIPKHKKGWGNDPDPNDMSLSANIERIRNYRNYLGHANEFALLDSDFIKIWSNIRTSVVEIDKFLNNNQRYEKHVDFLRYESMDSETADSFEENLQKQYKEDMEIKSQLSESHNNLGKQLEDIRSNQDMMTKQFEKLTKVVSRDQQRNGRSTKFEDKEADQYESNSVQRTDQFLEFLLWILTVLGIMRIFNFFWNTEELRKLEATEISDCSVSLKWDHTANERERQETSYIIAYRKTSSEDNLQRITVNCCEHKIETLQHNTEYEVQINVLTSSGEKELSKKIIFKTEELRELKVTEVSDCSVLLMWESRKEKQETSYIIEYRNTNLEDNVQRITLNCCEHKLDTLQHSTEYEVQVKVATSSGEKEHSKQIKFKTEELRELETTEISYRSVLLNWEDRRGRQETSYIIAYRCTNSENINRIIVNSCGHRLDNLKHSTEYEVQVKVMTSSGEKKHSTKKHFKTEGLQKLRYEDITVSSVLLKWKPKNNTQGDCPRGEEGVYIIEYVNAEPDSKTKRVEVKSCEYQLEKLKPSTEYRVQIKVKTDSGEYQHTEKVTFETEQVQPAPRLPFRTVQITPSSITTEWGNCEKWLSDQQRHYILTCTKNSETHSKDSESKNEIIEVNQDELPVQKCTGTVSELLSNTIYSLKVKAKNGNVVSSELVMERPIKTKVDALIEPFSSSEEAESYIRKTYENLITDVLDKIDTDMLAEYLLQMAIISKNSFDDIRGANLLKKNDLIVKNVLAKRNIAEYPHENFWEALDFYLPHTKRKLVENARKNEEQITLSLPSLSWNFINDHRDELDVDDILNTAHALFAIGYIDDSEHDDILLSKSPSKKVEAMMDIVSEKQSKVLFLQAFEARCNRTQLEGLLERQSNSESDRPQQDVEETTQSEEVRDTSQQDVEETAPSEEVRAQLILTGDEEILSQMFENPNLMKDLEDMIENNGFKVKLSKQNSIVIELSSSSETSYTEFVKILNEGRIDDFIEYLLAKHNISKDSPEGNTKIKLRLSTLPPAEDQSKMKEKILRRSFPHVLHKCLPNSIMEEIKKLKLPSEFRMKLQEGLNKSDNDDNLKKSRFLMTMLLREDTISEESTRCLMKNLVGSDILDYELKRNTGDILGKIVENYGHILRELHGNIIMKMNEIYAVFGDGVFRSDSKSKQDRSALFLEDVLTKESKVLDLANVLSMIELDSLLHDKESKIGQVKRVQQRGQIYHFFYERQMEIPIANEESRAACKYSPMQETNTERASQILLRPCEDQLRDVLRHHVPPALFHDVITRHRSNLLLTQSQADIILPRTGRYSGDYSDMNISLLYSLLRNISNIPSHNNGWGNTPDISDSSLSACIDRIWMARDTVVHCSRTILFEKEFNDLLNEIKMAVISMDSYLGNSNKYDKAVDFLLTETMDPDQAVFIQQLKKEVEGDKTTMGRISNLEKRVHEDISTVHKGVGRLDTELGGLDKKIEILGFSIRKHEKEMTRQVLGKISVQDVEPDVNILREKLIERNNEQTREMSPVTTDGDNLPIEHLFSTVVIREDVKENRKGKKSAQSEEHQEGKEVKSPENMLTKDGKPVPRVFMLGKAAHGKTTYCKWFLKTWCNTQQPGMSGRPLNKWENALSQFDFVFYIPLRHVDPSRADVTDMICQDILGPDPDLQATAKHVLSSKKYRCFIMMDGLDEWKPDQSVIDRLKYKGMPNIDNMSNCVIFTTMRPWKFSEVQGVMNKDRVIEILGLDDAGFESVIEKVLVYYHEMKPDTAEFEAKCKEIKSKLDNETVKSFIKIPLLAVVCVQIWYDGEQVGDSMTSFYIAMVNMLIKRAHLKHDTQKLSFESINVTLPKQMSAKKYIKNYSNVLFKLGKVAYEGLLSKEMKLVFQKDDLETEIGERELQFALDVGLISRRDVHSAMEEKVSVHFFHKSVQEFLAAIYIVTNKEVSDLFCKHLCDIKVIMELSNVIMFICGMCPCLGSVISQCVVSVADCDTEICRYRELPLGGNSETVEELYKLQVSWLRELEYGQTDSPVTDSPVTFHVSDVYVRYNSDIETVRVTRELLCDHHTDIRSLSLLRVHTDGDRGITNTVVNNLLSDPHRTRSLTMVFINGTGTDRTINKVCVPSLRALYLVGVKVANTNTVPGPVLCQCDRLQWLDLRYVTLGDRDLGLTPSMTLLQKVTLVRVNMTSSGWGRWLQSVVDIHHQFVVRLVNTNIDRHTVSTIHSSPHLSVILDTNIDRHTVSTIHSSPHLSVKRDTNIDRHTESTIHSSPHLSVTQGGSGSLYFTRVWPLTQDTQ